MTNICLKDLEIVMSLSEIFHGNFGRLFHTAWLQPFVDYASTGENDKNKRCSKTRKLSQFRQNRTNHIICRKVWSKFVQGGYSCMSHISKCMVARSMQWYHGLFDINTRSAKNFFSPGVSPLLFIALHTAVKLVDTLCWTHTCRVPPPLSPQKITRPVNYH